MADVLCFGNLQFDVLCRTVTALPAPGELRMIDAVDFALSGNGGNVAAVLGRLGVSVDLAGYSGADVIGEQFRTSLVSLGVGVDKLLCHPTAGTGTSVITLSPGGERSILFVNGANACFDLDTIPDEWLQNSRIVSVSSLFVLPNFTGEAVGRLFSRARLYECTTVLNICWDTQGLGLPFLSHALAEADYFLLSYDEGCQLTGCSNPADILGALARYAPGITLLTLGVDGCCWREASEDSSQSLRHMPAQPVDAIDCTGAGDSFMAGFIAGLAHNYALCDCVALGCRVAAYAVTGPGAYPRVPTLDEIHQLIEENL